MEHSLLCLINYIRLSFWSERKRELEESDTKKLYKLPCQFYIGTPHNTPPFFVVVVVVVVVVVAIALCKTIGFLAIALCKTIGFTFHTIVLRVLS